MLRRIVGVNVRNYQCEEGSVSGVKAVLVLEEDGFYYGYIAGLGSDEFVADFGDSMSFNDTIPHLAQMTMTKKQLRETLLYTDGSILANGRMWDIISKHLGAGVYKVTLKRMND